MGDKPYEPKPWEVSGFELCGWKQPDGRIMLDSDQRGGTLVSEFPKTVQLNGVVYTLEYVKWQKNGFGWGTYV